MSEISTSGGVVNTTSTPEQFGTAMASVSWWATSTQGEQREVHELYTELGGSVEAFVTDAAEYSSAAEMLDGVLDSDAVPDAEDNGSDDTVVEEVPVVTPVEPVRTSTAAQAQATLDKFGAHLGKVEQSNYTTAALAAQYVDEFLGAAPGKATHTAAVDRLANEWLKHDSEAVAEPVAQAMNRLRKRVSSLLKCHAVVTLLGDGSKVPSGDGTKTGRGRGKAKPMAWSTIKAFAPLVDRNDVDSTETWFVLPSVVQEAHALLAEVAKSGMAMADVVKQVSGLVSKNMLANHQAAKAKEAEVLRVANEARAKEMEDRKVLATVKAAAKEWEVAAKAPDATPETVQMATDAMLAVNVQEQAVKASTEESDKARALAAQQVKEAEEKAAAVTREEAKATAKAEKAAAKANGVAAPKAPPSPTSNQGTNLLASAKLGTVKDVAEMAVELITGSETPDDVLEAVLKTLDGCPALCKGSIRAIKAALASLAAPSRLTPATAANVLQATDKVKNGQLATV
jgi:hypothetical protein